MNSTGNIRIIATSDLHGKLLPWDYVLNQESKTGSMAQLSTALKEFSQNWRLTGINWDEDLHQKAVSLLADGKIALPEPVSSLIFNTKPIRVEDVGMVLN